MLQDHCSYTYATYYGNYLDYQLNRISLSIYTEVANNTFPNGMWIEIRFHIFFLFFSFLKCFSRIRSIKKPSLQCIVMSLIIVLSVRLWSENPICCFKQIFQAESEVVHLKFREFPIALLLRSKVLIHPLQLKNLTDICERLYFS